MCLFTSGKDIPPIVRISLRTLQYLVIPLFSIALLLVGTLHLGRCQAQPYLPIWHIVAGSCGLLAPIFYLLFDELNPRMSRRFPIISEVLDNLIVFVLPLYVIFEIGWLITGSFWTFGIQDVAHCDHTLYVFSIVVMINFWIHLLTPLAFMIGLCCTRVFPYCAYCAYWNILRTALDNWTRRTRMMIALLTSVPLGLSMAITGAISWHQCSFTSDYGAMNQTVESNLNVTENESEMFSIVDDDINKIPLWLLAAGSMILVVPLIYFIYDKYCKEEEGGPMVKNVATCVVIGFLTCGLAVSLLGFLWVFGAHQSSRRDWVRPRDHWRQGVLLR